MTIHKRQEISIWHKTRKRIWERDNHKCIHCGKEVKLKECHVDHIIRVKKGGNKDDNLRTLCRRCHVLRKDFGHRGMIASALRIGIIDHNWRNEVWE